MTNSIQDQTKSFASNANYHQALGEVLKSKNLSPTSSSDVFLPRRHSIKKQSVECLSRLQAIQFLLMGKEMFKGMANGNNEASEKMTNAMTQYYVLTLRGAIGSRSNQEVSELVHMLHADLSSQTKNTSEKYYSLVERFVQKYKTELAAHQETVDKITGELAKVLAPPLPPPPAPQAPVALQGEMASEISSEPKKLSQERVKRTAPCNRRLTCKKITVLALGLLLTFFAQPVNMPHQSIQHRNPALNFTDPFYETQRDFYPWIEHQPPAHQPSRIRNDIPLLAPPPYNSGALKILLQSSKKPDSLPNHLAKTPQPMNPDSRALWVMPPLLQQSVQKNPEPNHAEMVKILLDSSVRSESALTPLMKAPRPMSPPSKALWVMPPLLRQSVHKQVDAGPALQIENPSGEISQSGSTMSYAIGSVTAAALALFGMMKCRKPKASKSVLAVQGPSWASKVTLPSVI